MKINFYPVLLALSCAALVSCNKDQKTTADGAWLFPVAKGSLALTSLSNLKDLTYNVDVPAYSIGQPVGIVVASPGLNIAHVGPFAMEITPWLKSINIDSLDVTATLNNSFPIPIGAGTRISIRNTRDTVTRANIVAEAVIDRQIEPNERFSIDFKATNKVLGDSVYFVLDSFKSPPYAGVVFSGKATELQVTLKVIAASKIELYSNKVFSSIDTVAFKAGDQDNMGNSTGGIVSDTSVSGTVSVFTDNGLPAHMSFQVLFMDDSKSRVTDSLFSGALKIAGTSTDAAGTPLAINSAVTKLSMTRARVCLVLKKRYSFLKIKNTFLEAAGISPAAFLCPINPKHLSMLWDFVYTFSLSMFFAGAFEPVSSGDKRSVAVHCYK